MEESTLEELSAQIAQVEQDIDRDDKAPNVYDLDFDPQINVSPHGSDDEPCYDGYELMKLTIVSLNGKMSIILAKLFVLWVSGAFVTNVRL